METLLTLIFIQIATVAVIDLSGFIGELEKGLERWLHIHKAHVPKPFSCSLCMTHWIGLIWLVASGNITLAWYCVVLGLAFLTTVTADICWTVRDALTKAVGFINTLINK